MYCSNISSSIKLLLVLVICINSLAVHADEYQISVLGGIASSNDPNVSEENADLSFSVETGNTFQLIVNVQEGTNADFGISYYEFLLAHNRFDVTVDRAPGDSYKVELEANHVHLGGTYGWEGESKFRPYIALTAGLSEYTGENGNSDSFLSFAFGGGAKLFLAKAVALRVDARAFSVLLDDETRIFCQNNVCDISVEGELWIQPQISVGLVYSF